MNLKKLGAVCAVTLVAFANGALASSCEPTHRTQQSAIIAGAPLTLQATLSEIRHASPSVRAAGLETRARSAEADQAGRRLNPSVSFELENFAGSGPFTGLDQTETTVSLEQTIRLGGKRRHGERAARALAALASAECEVILRESELEGAILFYELIGAAQIASMAEEAATLATQLSDTVEKRVAAGAAAPPELSRALADAAAAQALATDARAQANTKRYELAVLWGASQPIFAMPQSNREQSNFVYQTDFEADEHPALSRAEAATEASRAQRRLEQSRIIPDVTVSAGFRQFEESGESALIAAVSVPLPLFDRNRDNVRAADFRAQARAIDRNAVQARLLAEQRAAAVAFNAARSKLKTLEDKAVPAAVAAFDASVRGYSVGKFDLTTTIDSRRALINTRLSAIEAALNVQIEDVRLRSLINAPPFDGGSHDQ